MRQWLSGPTQTPETLAALRALGVPANQVGALSAEPPEPVWPCNQPILSLYQAMPWAGGSPCWPLFPELARMWRIKRPDRPDALLLLQACEAEHRAYIKETEPPTPT